MDCQSSEFGADKTQFSANNAVVSYLTGQVSDAFVAVTVENKSN